MRTLDFFLERLEILLPEHRVSARRILRSTRSGTLDVEMPMSEVGLSTSTARSSLLSGICSICKDEPRRALAESADLLSRDRMGWSSVLTSLRYYLCNPFARRG